MHVLSKYDTFKVNYSRVPWILSYNGLYNDLIKKEPGLQLQETDSIHSVQSFLKSHPFVGSPVHNQMLCRCRILFKVNKQLFSKCPQLSEQREGLFILSSSGQVKDFLTGVYIFQNLCSIFLTIFFSPLILGINHKNLPYIGGKTLC